MSAAIGLGPLCIAASGMVRTGTFHDRLMRSRGLRKTAFCITDYPDIG